MKIRVDRDSVCAADDLDGHDRLVVVPDSGDLMGVLVNEIAKYPLPAIQGGNATWCVTSGRPIAVVAQQWPSPRMVSSAPLDVSDCKRRDGVISFHFNYLVQYDPDLILDILWRIRNW